MKSLGCSCRSARPIDGGALKAVMNQPLSNVPPTAKVHLICKVHDVLWTIIDSSHSYIIECGTEHEFRGTGEVRAFPTALCLLHRSCVTALERKVACALKAPNRDFYVIGRYLLYLLGLICGRPHGSPVL